LIDEFQDTDAVQCDIARALALDAAGPVLFVVGDPKQSIYGWRRADLAAYESFAEEVERAGGSRHTLHRNFRSRPLILDEVNRALEPVMRYERGLQPHYEPLVPDREAGVDHCPVELWVSWTRDANTGECRRPRAAEAAELEAAAVAADIARLRRAGVDLQEVAVLLRSRGDLDSYLEALRDAQLPFSVEGDRSYYQRREIIEVAALVRCIVNPNDHLSLLAWLRSASVGLPDAALVPMWARDFPAHASRLRAPDEAALADLRDIVTQAAESLSPDIPGLGRIVGWEHGVIAALETLAVLRRSFEADPPDVFVETLRTRTLVEATEAARYLGRYRAANLERFFAGLIDDLVRGGGDARAVARSLRRRIREAEDEEEAPVRHADEQAVRVLTIHQAKGLDFEHVYLVQAHREGRRDDPALLCGEVDGSVEYRLCEGSTLGFEALRAQRRRVAQAEQVRTLYVGLTRAKERLVVCGNWPAGDERRPPEDARHYVDLLMWRDAPRPELGALFDDPKSARGLESGGVLWRFPARGGAPKPGRPAVQTPALPSHDAVAADATRIAARRRTAAREMERPFRGTASNLQAEPERKFAATGASVAAAVGSALHGILEHFDPDAEPEAERARHRAELGARLETLVAPAELGAALERGTDLLERLHSGPLLDRLRALGSAAARELPILAPPSRAVGYTAGVIDLLYADPETGEWVVADYKSDAVESEAEIRALAGTYAAQGAVYTEAVRAALELDAPPRFELWLLHAGRILPVPAATLAAP
jgi:ATP-dependent helicase/nuclease subunit A